MDTNTEKLYLGSMIEGAGANCELRSPDTTHESCSGIISVQLLEFKSSLHEAVEELHIHRDAEMRYEAQICKLVLEKQELEWQTESLRSQIDKMTKEHSESTAALKKQEQLRGIEGEKGKHQLSAEMKDKEITSLKEELKLLQLFKYSLEKKLGELEQKLQLHTQVKERHLTQLGEVEKRFGAVSKQCAVVKQAHDKLEQNVEAAMRLNKKFTSFIKKQESTIVALKTDVQRLNSELVKCKVLSVCRPGEESSHQILKDQHLQELQQRLTVETELNKKLTNEIAVERTHRQELLSSLQHAQSLLQTESQALSRTEQQLFRHTEEFQVFKCEHEMIQKRGQDKGDELVQQIEEYKHSQTTLEKEMQVLRAKMQTDQEELKALREAYDDLHEKHHQLSACAMHQTTHVQNLENGMRDNFNIQRQSPSSLKCHIHLDIAGSCKDASLDTEDREVSPQNSFEQMRYCKETEDIPDERTVECQEAAEYECFRGANGEVNVGSQTDRNVPLSSQDPELSVMGESGNTADRLTTSQQKDPAVRQEASVGKSVPVCTTFDNDCPSNDVRSYTDGCLAKLSDPETRSVYGVASDPMMSETRAGPEALSLGVSEMLEHKTSDKHTSKASQDIDWKKVEPTITEPETSRLLSVSPEEGETCAERPAVTEESTTNPVLQDMGPHRQNPVTHEELDAACLSPLQQSTPQHSDTLHVRVLPRSASVPGAHCRNSADRLLQSPKDPLLNCGRSIQQQALEDTSSHVGMTEAESVVGTEPNISAAPPGSFSQSTIAYIPNLADTLIESRTAGNCATVSGQTSSEQHTGVSPCPRGTVPHGSSLPSPTLTKPSEHLYDSQKQIPGIEPSYVVDSSIYRASHKLSMNPKETVNAQLKCTKTAADVSSREPKLNFLASPNSSALAQKPTPPPGVQEVHEPLYTPLFHKQRNKGTTVLSLTSNKSSISSDQESDWHGERNAIKQACSDISAEKDSRVAISFGSSQPVSPVARPGGRALKQDRTPPHCAELHGRRDVARTAREQTTPTSREKEHHSHSDIRAQIAKIDQFLASEGLKPPKRCRTDESEVLKD
ncbi:coiled-coil domain-containing protein 73 isoform X3 [Brachyhypopomus gauderio]|uniref:coiled-coil domain-containing protein 73 isoform X3 n=1 Tax=Brachyhypopomus gauderio TaxID=698409 RepID=UPI00404142FF